MAAVIELDEEQRELIGTIVAAFQDGVASDDPRFDYVEMATSEEMAELDAIPGLRENVWDRYDRLKEAGLIK